MTKTNLQQEFQQKRLGSSIGILLEDINRWEQATARNPELKHHLGQFAAYCTTIHCRLMASYDATEPSGDRASADIAWQWADDRLVFEARVISILTDQWEVLREAASQRSSGNPYAQAIKGLDRRTAVLCKRLEQGIPKQTCPLFPSLPLVGIGRLARLQLLGEAPAVIGVPLGALSKQEARRGSLLALAHELGHLVCAQSPDLVEDICSEVASKWQHAHAPIRALHKTMEHWIEEIVADLFGTALEQLPFVCTAIDLSLAPEALAVRGDKTHPVRCLRPYIHIEALCYLQQQKASSIQATSKEIEDQEQRLNNMVAPLLSRRFDLDDAATFITIETVRQQLRALTRAILAAKPASFAGQSVGEVLSACAMSRAKGQARAKGDFHAWGEKIGQGTEPPVLKPPIDKSNDPGTIIVMLAAAFGL